MNVSIHSWLWHLSLLLISHLYLFLYCSKVCSLPFIVSFCMHIHNKSFLILYRFSFSQLFQKLLWSLMQFLIYNLFFSKSYWKLHNLGQWYLKIYIHLKCLKKSLFCFFDFTFTFYPYSTLFCFIRKRTMPSFRSFSTKYVENLLVFRLGVYLVDTEASLKLFSHPAFESLNKFTGFCNGFLLCKGFFG